MSLERWGPEDSAEYKSRVDEADRRLEAWGRWQSTASPDQLSYPRQSPFVRAMKPQADEAQAGARHLRSDLTCTDEEALEVDAVLADWRVTHRYWWKVARKEYLTSGASEKKARELGVNRTEYRRQLDALRIAMWKELASGARSGRTSGKLTKVSVKNARS